MLGDIYNVIKTAPGIEILDITALENAVK